MARIVPGPLWWRGIETTTICIPPFSQVNRLRSSTNRNTLSLVQKNTVILITLFVLYSYFAGVLIEHVFREKRIFFCVIFEYNTAQAVVVTGTRVALWFNTGKFCCLGKLFWFRSRVIVGFRYLRR